MVKDISFTTKNGASMHYGHTLIQAPILHVQSSIDDTARVNLQNKYLQITPHTRLHCTIFIGYLHPILTFHLLA